jgi:uncharacterized membrane protein YvbJ
LSKKKPRFFCDNCGHEVDAEVKSCPKCGRFFASVRCPSCGFSGEEKVFFNGCPACGYSAIPSKPKPAKVKKTRKKKRAYTEHHSPWTYIIAGFLLLILVVLLSWLMTR